MRGHERAKDRSIKPITDNHIKRRLDNHIIYYVLYDLVISIINIHTYRVDDGVSSQLLRLLTHHTHFTHMNTQTPKQTNKTENNNSNKPRELAKE